MSATLNIITIKTLFMLSLVFIVHVLLFLSAAILKLSFNPKFYISRWTIAHTWPVIVLAFGRVRSVSRLYRNSMKSYEYYIWTAALRRYISY